MMGSVVFKLTGNDLKIAIDQYVAEMNTIEASLMSLLGDKYISELQSSKALKLLEQARRQSQEARAMVS